MDEVVRDIIVQILNNNPLRLEGRVRDDGIERMAIYEVSISQDNLDKMRKDMYEK